MSKRLTTLLLVSALLLTLAACGDIYPTSSYSTADMKSQTEYRFVTVLSSVDLPQRFALSCEKCGHTDAKMVGTSTLFNLTCQCADPYILIFEVDLEKK